MPRGNLALLLHAHLPWVGACSSTVHPEPVGLCEALTTCYLPLVAFLLRRVEATPSPKVALAISPRLASAWTDPGLKQRYGAYLDEAEAADALLPSPSGQPRAARQIWQAIDGDLPRALVSLERAGLVELLASAATHAYLPLVRPRSLVAAQVQLGFRAHEVVFGQRSRGFFLPECGYEPGVGQMVADGGGKYFVVDGRGLIRAEPAPRWGCWAPLWLSHEGLACVGGPPPSAVANKLRLAGQGALRWAWPRSTPGGADFHGGRAEKSQAEPFHPRKLAWELVDEVRQAAAERGEAMDRPPLALFVLRAELLGYFWSEGFTFFRELCRRVSEGWDGLELVRPADYLARDWPLQEAEPASSSWGSGGDGTDWLTSENCWIQRHLCAIGQRLVDVVARQGWPGPMALPRRALEQAARELLAAQASDWLVGLRTPAVQDYARCRLQSHLGHALRLLEETEHGVIGESHLSQRERVNPLLTEVDVYPVLRQWSAQAGQQQK
jgi:1,4-alpha-glucan branching enzyme